MYYFNQFYRISSPSQLIYDVVVNMLNNIDKLQCAVCSRVLVPTTYNKSKTFFSKLEAKILEGHLDGQVSQTSTNSINFEVLHCPNDCSYYLVQNNIDQRPRRIKYSSSFITKLLNQEGHKDAFKLMSMLSGSSGSLYSVCYGFKSKFTGALDDIKLIQVLDYNGYKFHFYIASNRKWKVAGDWVRTIVNYIRV